MKNLSNMFLRLAVIWFVVGIALGLVMAASHDHSLRTVHAHVHLLGWVSMGLFSAFYRGWPAAALSALARVHFWLYVPAHLVMMVSLALLYEGVEQAEAVVAMFSVLLGLAVLCFATVVWKHTGSLGGANCTET